ncbi:female sterile (1) Nasrat [Cochliomyia hominivorax]
MPKFKKSVKNSMFLYPLLINFLIIKLIVLNVNVVEISAISEQQRQEIAKLKSELSAAFKTDNKNVAAKGVIVQPAWTQGSKPDPKESVKVEVNAQNRKEAAALRAEINQAVAKDKYATKDAAKTQDIKKLEATLSRQQKGKEALDSVVGIQADALNKEIVGANLDEQKDQETDNKAPNIITANIGDDTEIDIRKLRRLVLSKRRTKEVLILNYIEEDLSFDLGTDVVEWEHIVHAGHEYFIGRRLSDLLIVRNDASKYEKSMVVEVGQLISDIETYTFWNLEQEQQEGVILISSGERVLWYRANNETKKIELYWDWLVGYTITGLTYFTLDSKDYLVISSNQSSLAGHFALNIYQFKLQNKEFWIVQRLQLEKACDKVTVLNTGRDVILAIPQNDTADIYTFNPHEAAFSHIRFQLKRSVKAEGIISVAGFTMGGRSYLALTGYQPQILLYQQGDFVSKTILGNNFGLVELFFPIPVRTYRDDLILLVQHRVDFMTHILTVVETLIWDGEAFETSIPVPCHLGEHVVYGVACMLDLQRDEGLKGAVLLRRGEEISVIVPRHKAESGLFRFHTDLLAKNSELLDLQEIFQFIKDWVKEQDDLIQQATEFVQLNEQELQQTRADLSELESLKTPELNFQGEVSEIYVNDHKWSLEDSNTDLNTLIKQIEDLDRSLFPARQRRNLKDIEQENLEFDEVWVNDLQVELVNGEKYFIQNGELNFKGLIALEELEYLADEEKDFLKRQIIDEDFVLDGDLEFNFINDLLWSDFKDNLVFRTQKQKLQELEVEGEILCENLLTLKTLNTLDFPDDYMLSTGPSISIVEAEKHFANSLSASAVDTNGLINGKNPEDAITLMDEQKWEGMPTFQHLEVTEILELQGKVQGRDVSSMPQNPSLKESNIIEASCHFNELLVNGPVILKGEMDNVPLASRFKDIVLRPLDPLEEIEVPSSKSFDTVMFPVDFQLENNNINEIPAPNFVTVHTQQVININSLEGYVYFYNLTLNGTYDGVKLEQVLKNIIMLDNATDLSTTELIFPQDLKATNVNVLDKLNNENIKNNLQTLKEDLIIKSADFVNLTSQQADFARDILGKGKLNNIELHMGLQEISWHEPPIKGNIFLNELILEQGLTTDEMHGIKAEYLLDFLDKIEELPDMVLSGQIQVDHITVTGDVQLNKLNGQLFDEEIQLTTINLNRPNYLSTQMKFKNRVELKGHLKLMADFRGQYVPDLIEDIIIRSSNSSIEIKAPKSFLKPLKVLGNLQAKAINGKSMDLIGWKNKENQFQGSLQIKGNLVVRDLKIQGNINNFQWQSLQDKLYFDAKLNNFVLKNLIEFKTPLYLEDLTVLGDLNDIPNLADFFENLIYKNHLCILKGKNIFTGRVTIEKGAFIKNLNGYDLQYLFNNLVFIHGTEPVVIHAPVKFENNIKVNELQIRKSLSVKEISGCSLNEWLNNTLRVDQDHNIPHYLQFAEGSLDDNSLLVHYLKDIDLTKVLTLNTPQNFSESIKFSEVFLKGFISSKGPVNNKSLQEEFNNTLMTSGSQHISTPLNIHTVMVLGDLIVRGPVNTNKYLKDVATLQEDLVLESPVYFQSLYTPQVVMQDPATGIDFNKWFSTALQYQDSNTQYITGNWSTKYLKVEIGPKDFQYTINGFEPWQYYSYIRSARSQDVKEYEDEDICQVIEEIKEKLANKRIYLNYIEEVVEMDLNSELKKFNETLRKLFHLNFDQENLLLVNLKCKTLIFKWLNEKQSFVYKNSFETGPFDQVEIIPSLTNKKEWQFITTHITTEPFNCSINPSNKWKILNDTIIMDKKLTSPKGLIYKELGNNNLTLWSVDQTTLKQLDLSNYETVQKWQLPVESNKTRYRFVPYKNHQKILLSNGKHLVSVTNHLNKKLKKSAEDPQFLQSSVFPENPENIISETILKPNNSLTRSFVFADFKQVVERILIDLAERLQQQINITQLSIPESDLFDEHLINDFMFIMEELRKQNIYPQEEFNISFDNLIIPENPAQVLAARVVEIVWPVVIEMEEIHSYLKTNKSHDHPLCSCISKSLGYLIRDVLNLANAQNSSQVHPDYSQDLVKIIERIREFEKDVDKFLKALEKHDRKESLSSNMEKENLQLSSTSREFQILSDNAHDLSYKESSLLPGFEQGEVLSLRVGTTKNPLHLWAVTNTKTPLIATNNPGIYLYLQNLRGQIYQVIAAIKPRSLQQLRIQQETLLFYIENCCHVKVLRYQGSQGFQKFAEFYTQENILQILTITVPYESGKAKYFVTLMFENQIKFYEIVVEGFIFEEKQFSNLIPLSLNCK